MSDPAKPQRLHPKILALAIQQANRNMPVGRVAFGGRARPGEVPELRRLNEIEISLGALIDHAAAVEMELTELLNSIERSLRTDFHELKALRTIALKALDSRRKRLWEEEYQESRF